MPAGRAALRLEVFTPQVTLRTRPIPCRPRSRPPASPPVRSPARPQRAPIPIYRWAHPANVSNFPPRCAVCVVPKTVSVSFPGTRATKEAGQILHPSSPVRKRTRCRDSSTNDQGIVRSQDATERSWFKVSRFCCTSMKYSCDRRHALWTPKARDFIWDLASGGLPTGRPARSSRLPFRLKYLSEVLLVTLSCVNDEFMR